MHKGYLIQWMEHAGIHEARFGDDLNGATVLGSLHADTEQLLIDQLVEKVKEE